MTTYKMKYLEEYHYLRIKWERDDKTRKTNIIVRLNDIILMKLEGYGPASGVIFHGYSTEKFLDQESLAFTLPIIGVDCTL